MKKKHFLILPAVIALAFMSLLIVGCDKSAPDESSVIGTWYCEIEGEYDDIIHAEYVFKEDGTLDMTLVTADYEPYEFSFKWKLEGNDLVFKDFDETDDIDYEDISYAVEITNGRMILDPDENCSYELIKK